MPSTTATPPTTRTGRIFPILFTVVVLAGAVLLGLALAEVGPPWFAEAGSVAVVTSYAAALAARTGVRIWPPAVFTVLAGLVVVLGDTHLPGNQGFLRAGAAVLTAVLASVLAVLVTQPAVRFLRSVLEAMIALGVAAVGGLAVVGFGPSMLVPRFEYLSLALALGFGALIISRLGAGLHGLGGRGLVFVMIAVVVLAVSLAYAEMLRQYGTPALQNAVYGSARWTHDHLGAVPRPIEALLGIPALVWGTHMRARRRLGWWLCLFGVAFTVTVAGAFVQPARTLVNVGLAQAYSGAVGLFVGYLLIRVDVVLTAPKGRRSRRVEEQASAVRPEPSRFQSLL